MPGATPVGLLLLLVLPEMLGAPREVQSLQCHDWEGKPVVDGIKYIPKKDDPCMACVCDDGFPVMCTAVQCSPPECVLVEAVEGECCRFHCIDPGHTPSNKTKDAVVPRNPKSNEVDKTNLGLRLIASTVTSFLILALIVFMVHRLRQRRMLIMMRRMHADQRDEDTVAYMSQFDQVDMGIEFPPYEEPPPPYTPPKPPDIPQGEAPPPYEVTPGRDGSHDREPNNNIGMGGTLPNHGPRPLQGNGNMPVASSSMDPVNADAFPFHHHHDLPSPAEEQVSLPISRSAREIQNQSEALSPPGGMGAAIRSPSQHEYENLREICARHLLMQRAASSEAETASPISTPPDFSPDSDYPAAAAAAAMSMSFHSQGAPASQMVVRMHQDNPRSHILRDGDVMTTSLPAYLTTDSRMANDHLLDDVHPWVPSYRTQFIKRSESVEIKCGSNSPRNSFYTEECGRTPAHPEERGDGALSPCPSSGSGSPPTDHGSKGKKKRPLAPNVTWNKSCRPFRIRLDSTSPVGVNEEGAVAGGGGWTTPGQEEGRPHHSTYGSHCITSPSPPSVHHNRHSLPPIDLDLPDPVDAILGASSTKFYKGHGCSGASTDPSPSDDILEVGVSPTGSGRVTTSESSSRSSDHNAGPAVASGSNGSIPTPSSSGNGTASPQSPMGPNMIRSSSITSQVSQFSVCSETGEKKRPRPNVTFPRSLRNDAHYPLSPLSSNYASPMNATPPVLKPRRHSPPTSQQPSGSQPRTVGPHENRPSPVSSPLEAALSPFREAPGNLNEQQGAAPHQHRPYRNKISYVDVSPEREKSSSAASTPSSTDSSGGYPKQPTATSPLTNDSTMSSLSPLTPDSTTLDNQQCLTNFTSMVHTPRQDAEQEEHSAVRKVKKQHSQRKRRPRSMPATNGGEAGSKTAAPTSHSPERLRRLSRNIDTSTTFKQYGFIDDPDVINNARDVTMGHNNGSLPRNHNLRRQHSCEKDTTTPREHRDNSAERHRDHSTERQRSRERRRSRERKSSSRERCEHSQDRKKEKSSRNDSHERDRQKGDRRERSASRERSRQSKRPAEQVVPREGYTAPTTTSPGELGTGGGTVNRTVAYVLDNHISIDDPVRMEGRKRERDHNSSSQAASLERRKKRRSTSEQLFSESSQNNNYPMNQRNGHVVYASNGVHHGDDDLGYPTNHHLPVGDHEKHHNDQSPTQRGRRSKNNRTHESRHSVPLIVHRNR